MYCGNCGNQLNEQERFCPVCGARVPESDGNVLDTGNVDNGADGIIATNTTIDYSLVKNPKDKGGISGQALKKRSREVFQILSENLFEKTTLISIGGIDDGEEAYERIKLGASLIQIYTTMIFEGPCVIREINKTILEKLEEDGFKNISEAIGKSLC